MARVRRTGFEAVGIWTELVDMESCEKEAMRSDVEEVVRSDSNEDSCEEEVVRSNEESREEEVGRSECSDEIWGKQPPAELAAWWYSTWSSLSWCDSGGRPRNRRAASISRRQAGLMYTGTAASVAAPGCCKIPKRAFCEPSWRCWLRSGLVRQIIGGGGIAATRLDDWEWFGRNICQ